MLLRTCAQVLERGFQALSGLDKEIADKVIALGLCMAVYTCLVRKIS